MDKMTKLQDGDTLVLAGSIPSSLSSDIYERLLRKLAGRKINIVVDAEKDLLVKTLHYHPFLIKPNHHELGGAGYEIAKKEGLPLYETALNYGVAAGSATAFSDDLAGREAIKKILGV